MTVNIQVPISSYVYAGSSTFTFGWTLLSSDDIRVNVNDVEKTLGVDFTVNGVGSPTGGSITYLGSLTVGDRVVVFRDTALERTTNYQENGDLPARTLNFDLDRIWLALQEIFNGSKGVPSAVRAPIGETIPAMAPAAQRANKILGFDSLGNPVATLPQAGDATGLALSLLSSLASQGAGQIGFSRGSGYSAGTLGFAVQASENNFWGYLNAAERQDAFARAGLIDVSAKFQQFLNDGGGFVPGGMYRVDTQPNITKSGVVLRGQGTENFGLGTAIMTPNNIIQLSAVGAFSGVQIKDISFVCRYSVSDVAGPSTTATFSGASNTITVASAANLQKGIRILASGIPSNTYIQRIDGTTIYLCDSVGNAVVTLGSGSSTPVTTLYRRGRTVPQLYSKNGIAWCLDNVRFYTLLSDADYSPENVAGALFERDSLALSFKHMVRNCFFHHAQLVMGCSDSDIEGTTIWANPFDFALKRCAPDVRLYGGSISAGVLYGDWITNTGTEPSGAANHLSSGVNYDDGDLYYAGYPLFADTPLNLQITGNTFPNARKACIYARDPVGMKVIANGFLNGNKDGIGNADVEIEGKNLQPTGNIVALNTFRRTSASSPTAGYAIREINAGNNPASNIYALNSVSTNYQPGGFQIALGVNAAGYPKLLGNYGPGVETEMYGLGAQAVAPFTATLTGCTTSPTATIAWSRQGNLITLTLPTLFATSNSTGATLTGMPTAIRPATAQRCPCHLIDNSVNALGYVDVMTDGTLVLHTNSATGAMTNGGSKGSLLCNITYQLSS